MVGTALVVSLPLLLLLHLPSARADLRWVSRPQHTPVIPGQDLVLNCQAEALSGGSLSYTWLFNHSRVQAKSSVFTNASLFVPRVSEEDEGEYTCVVTAGDGELAEEISASAQVVMAYIEDFVEHPQDMHTIVGTEVVLTCVTGRSVPHPTVHWEVNGQEVDVGQAVTASYGEYDGTGLSSQLSMKLTYLMDSVAERRFRCVARNGLTGQELASLEANVTAEAAETFKMAPRIMGASPPEVLAAESQRVVLPCQVIGYPTPLVVWWKDGDVVNSSRVEVTPESTLIIPSFRQEDTGEYWCEANNSVGAAISNTTSVLKAYIGVEFKTDPSETSSLAGHPVTLRCSAPDSLPPAVVTWYKDYIPFSPRSGVFAVTVIRDEQFDSWDLHFSSVQENDEGDYYCVASNNLTEPASRTSKVARLTVYGAPVIMEPPINMEVLKGTLLHMSCHVDLATVQSVFWTFHGKRVNMSQTVSVTDHGQNLWVSDVGKSWEGLYTCVAENLYGQKTASAFVTVIVPPVRLQDLGARSVLEGDMVLLPCFVYGDPDPVIVWLHDGQRVVEDERRRQLTTGLFILSAEVADRGEYSCQGTNSGGRAWSNGTLDVRVLPTAVANQSVAAVLGQPLTLTCLVQGHPLPSVHWLHNGTEVTNGTKFSPGGVFSLTRPIFSWSLAGRYTCVAENSDGRAAAETVVATQVIPSVKQIQGETSVDVNRSINLTCVHSGVPSPVVAWFHAGERVTASLDGRISFPEQGTLLVKFARKDDQGRYECTATNIVGSSRNFVDIFIVEPPNPPELLEAQPLSMNSVLLLWRPVFQDQQTTVESFIIRYRQRVGGELVVFLPKVPSPTSQWEVTGLKPGVEYVFTVSAENTAGEGAPSNPLTATTFESGPSEPRNLRAVFIESRRVQVSWEVPAETNGQIRQYQLQYRRQSRDPVYTKLHVSSPVLPTQTVIVENLAPFTVYELRVRAANVWNGSTLWGQFSALLVISTTMSNPSAPPANIRATSMDPFSLRVEWHPVPKSHQHGPIIGYRLTYYNQEDSTARQVVMTTNSSQHSLTITGLSPWTLYSLTVEAENSIGFGPKSQVVSVKTLPTVPGAPPQDVTAVSLPGDIIGVRWQPIPRKERHCELTSYLIQYRQTGTTLWAKLSTPDNITISAVISDVEPWSWYEIRVAAVTSQVTPGRSPFSSSVELQTLQTAAGQVRSVSFLVSTTTVRLSWAPTLHPNGVVSGYRVDYNTISDQESGPKKTVVTNSTHAELGPLLPGALYNISVVVINAAGTGQPTLLRVRTASLLSTSMTTTTEQALPQEVFTWEQTGEMTTNATEGSSGASHNLPVIVAGSLTGAVILIIVLSIFLCRCVKTRREHRAKYLIQDGRMSFKRAAAGSFYRHFDEPDVVSTSTSPSSSDHNIQQQQQQHQQSEGREHQQHLQREDSAPQQLTDVTWLTRQAQRVERGAEGPPVYLPGGGEGAAAVSDSRMPFPPLPFGGRDVFIVEGIDNLAFVDDRMSLPGLPPPDKEPTGGATPEVENQAPARKRGRMRSESAAAIAVLRSATSASLLTDDMDLLLSNEFTNVDSEVVFKQRTVL